MRWQRICLANASAVGENKQTWMGLVPCCGQPTAVAKVAHNTWTSYLETVFKELVHTSHNPGDNPGVY